MEGNRKERAVDARQVPGRTSRMMFLGAGGEIHEKTRREKSERMSKGGGTLSPQSTNPLLSPSPPPPAMPTTKAHLPSGSDRHMQLKHQLLSSYVLRAEAMAQLSVGRGAGRGGCVRELKETRNAPRLLSTHHGQHQAYRHWPQPMFMQPMRLLVHCCDGYAYIWGRQGREEHDRA